MDTKTPLKEIKVRFGEVNIGNINLLKLLNDTTLAVKYGESFYRKMLTYNDYTALAYLNGLLVGAIACRVEPYEDDPKTLYILTFNVLKPYRKYKIGKELFFFCDFKVLN